MFQEFYPIRLQGASEVNFLLKPEREQDKVDLRSPALGVMTDFSKISPVTIEETSGLGDALEYMKSQHVRLLLAVDGQGNFSGIVTAGDLVGDKPMAIMETHGMSRDQVQIRHIMLRKENIRALTYEQIQQSRIGDVMLTLKGSGDQHALVVDESYAGVKRLRGLISASDISRLLKIRFDVMYEVKSFAEIERVITQGQGL
ncbi:CBS domain-containing protein [Marinobacterium jannaschii]|uniref:CBS domain-containing protein n=1 Tax=Marinobacterium jannaschii TaxID=64970 RepID=UPI000485DFDD|nr:CBS domain-containing protein [Marinobacterium jannaschii]